MNISLKAWVLMLGWMVMPSLSFAVDHPGANARKPVLEPMTHLQVLASVGPEIYLSGAIVKVMDARGRLIGRGKTNTRGSMMLQVPASQLKNLPLTFTTFGGMMIGPTGEQFRGPKFHGHLRGETISGSIRQGKHNIVFLDLLSTASKKLKSARHFSYARAMNDVRNALGFVNSTPVDILRYRNNHVDKTRLLAILEKSGSFDAFAAKLSRRIARKEAITELAPLRSPFRASSAVFARTFDGAPTGSGGPPHREHVLEPRAASTSSSSVQCNIPVPNGASSPDGLSTEIIQDFGVISIQLLLDYYGAPEPIVDGTDTIAGTLLSGGGSSTPSNSAVSAVDQQLSCIAGQLSALKEEVGQLLLGQDVGTATDCANQVATQYTNYQGLVADALPNADGTPSSQPLNSSNTDLIADLPGFLNAYNTCGAAINDMLFGTAGDQGSGWQQVNKNMLAEGSWFTQLQVQQLQQFLSYWGTVLYDQYVLISEYYNYYGLSENMAIANGNAPGYSTVCKGSSANTAPSYTDATFCVWQNNIANAYPADLYSDEIGIPGNGIAVNGYPAGLALGLSQTALIPNWIEQYLLSTYTTPNGYGSETGADNKQWIYDASAVASKAYGDFNAQGINPKNLSGAVETFTNPQALRTLQVQAADVSALNSKNTYSSTAGVTGTQYLVSAINSDSSSLWTSLTGATGNVAFYASNDVTYLSYWMETSCGSSCYWNESIQLNAAVNNPATYQIKCPPPNVPGYTNSGCSTDQSPVMGVLLGRTWWPGASSAASYVPPTPPSLPGQPTGVTVTAATNGNPILTVGFTAPSLTGYPATLNYTASCTSSVDGTVVTATGSNTSLNVTNLVPGNTYSCSVQAANASGSGPVSASVSGVPIGKPNPPTLVSAASNWSGQILLNFTPPANTEGAAINSYFGYCESQIHDSLLFTPNSATSPLVITTAVPGATYTCYAQDINTLNVYSAASNPVTVTVSTNYLPAAPALVSVESAGSQTAVLTFNPPAPNGGTAITGYMAACAPLGTSAWVYQKGSASPITLTGLDNNLTYGCQVAAQNLAGTGANSNTMNVTVPDAPQLLSVTSPDSRSAVLTFNPPAQVINAPVTAYIAACAPKGTSNWIYLNGSGSPMTFTSLTGGVSYTCQVAAQIASGFGAISNTLDVTVPLAGTPSAPILNSLTINSSNNPVLSFAAPASSGSSPITGYIAACAPQGTTTWNYLAGSVSPLTYTNLSGGYTYTCEVAAQNATGVGAISGQLSVYVPKTGAPSAPVLNSVTSPAPNNAVLGFAAPVSSGSSAITGYIAACAPQGTTSWTYQNGAASPITFTGLTAGVSYTCEIAAQNAVGGGAISNTANVVVSNSNVPAAPTLNSVTSSAWNTAVLTFAAPASNGGPPVTDYIAACAPQNTTNWVYMSGSGSPISYSNLVSNQSYTCEVAAQNVEGLGAVSNSLIVTTPAGPSVPPTLNAATPGATNSGEITLTFTAPANNGGSAFTGFEGLCTPTAGGATKTATNSSGTATTVSVTGLTKGTLYSCDVQSINGSGHSSSSNAIQATAP